MNEFTNNTSTQQPNLSNEKQCLDDRYFKRKLKIIKKEFELIKKVDSIQDQVRQSKVKVITGEKKIASLEHELKNARATISELQSKLSVANKSTDLVIEPNQPPREETELEKMERENNELYEQFKAICGEERHKEVQQEVEKNAKRDLSMEEYYIALVGKENFELLKKPSDNDLN